MLNLMLEFYMFFQVILEYGKGNLSPVLFFSMFLNDLTEFVSHAYDFLNDISDMAHILLSNYVIEVYFKLYILLYTDDSVMFAESEDELQAELNAMFLYCKSWNLEVNLAKLKSLLFQIGTTNMLQTLYAMDKS